MQIEREQKSKAKNKLRFGRNASQVIGFVFAIVHLDGCERCLRHITHTYTHTI